MSVIKQKIYSLSLMIFVGLWLSACGGDTTAIPVTPTPSPTLWPTLAAVFTPEPQPNTGDSSIVVPVGPQLTEKFRVDLRDDSVSIFPLEGSIDHPVRVEVIVLSGNPDPVITISNTTGDRLAFADTGDAGQPEVIGQFIFPGDGFYELGITSQIGSGEVGVSVYRLDPADLEGGGVFNSYDEELRGTMDQPASYHTFRLPLERGQRVDIGATALTEGLDLLFEVYGPDGVILEARDDNVGVDPHLWNFMPSQSGIHTIVLSNFDENFGEYVIAAHPSHPGGEAVVGSRTPLSLDGSPRRSTWLTLEGRALDAVRVEARAIDSGVDITISMTDPYGNRIVIVNETEAGEPEQLTLVQFPFDGEYHIEFLTTADSGEIDYFIRPIRLEDLEVGGLIAAGNIGFEGDIVGPGTAIAYAFDIVAGDLIGIDAHATGGTGLDLGFDLYSPDGFLLISRDDVVGKDPIVDRIELAVGGRYVLVLWNFGGTFGPFDIFVTNPNAPDAAPTTP